MDSVILRLLLFVPFVACARRPNILFIWADDMGWGDVSWADYPEIPTPNLKQLKDDGTEMMQFYTQSKCTPSRAALMTSKYPYRYGAQTKDVYKRGENSTLPYDLKLLPAYLKDLGYATHMAGKWHLGYCNNKAIPTSRGFDTFFGAWTNTEDYWYHDVNGYDWNWNGQPYFEANGTYNTHLITNHTQHVLMEHFTDSNTKHKPVFFYVSFLAPHDPAMAPEKYIEGTDCRNIVNDATRRIYCGMVAAVDEGVGNITKTLRELGKLDDFIIIFASDNGGAMNAGASNFPLRGRKQTVYEGGTRVRTIFHAPRYLDRAPKEYDGLTHVTDILPTLYEAARGNMSDLPGDLDGISFWPRLRQGKPTKRHWMVYNMDSSRQLIALRLKNRTHNFKLVYHNTTRYDGYYPNRGDPTVLGTLRNRYTAPDDGYRMFNMDTNPNEYEPSAEHPDAALQFPEVKKELADKMADMWVEEDPRPLWVRLPNTDPGLPKNNNGAWGPGEC